jgi:hypothetical protein
MQTTDMIRELVSLSSGTLAKLFDTADYAALDSHLAEWVAWVGRSGRPFDSWVDCWHAYNS